MFHKNLVEYLFFKRESYCSTCQRDNYSTRSRHDNSPGRILYLAVIHRLLTRNSRFTRQISHNVDFSKIFKFGLILVTFFRDSIRTWPARLLADADWCKPRPTNTSTSDDQTKEPAVQLGSWLAGWLAWSSSCPRSFGWLANQRDMSCGSRRAKLAHRYWWHDKMTRLTHNFN